MTSSLSTTSPPPLLINLATASCTSPSMVDGTSSASNSAGSQPWPRPHQRNTSARTFPDHSCEARHQRAAGSGQVLLRRRSAVFRGHDSFGSSAYPLRPRASGLSFVHPCIRGPPPEPPHITMVNTGDQSFFCRWTLSLLVDGSSAMQNPYQC